MKSFYKYLEEKEGFVKEKHSAKWHRCVDKVRAQGGVESPEAVCTAALGDESFESYETNLKEVSLRDALAMKMFNTTYSMLTDEQKKQVDLKIHTKLYPLRD